MARVTGIGGVFFKSRNDSAALVAWYQKHLGMQLESWGGAINFVVGDFNGDGSQDIAVVVKPGKGMLPELNSEYANWIREDPVEVGKLAAHAHEQQSIKKRKPTVVTARDNLLAVIHGYQAAGWRDPKATQTYLLKNAVGEKLSAQSSASLLSDTANRQQLPRLRGDVIRETLNGIPGLLYWTGARYAWHPQ